MAPASDYKQLHVLMSEGELAAVRRQAEAHGVTVSEYVRATLLEAQARTKREARPDRQLLAIGLLMKAQLGALESRKTVEEAEHAAKAAGIENLALQAPWIEESYDREPQLAGGTVIRRRKRST